MVYGTDGLKEIQSAPAGHLLIKQNYAIRLPLKQNQRVVTVRGRFDGKSLLFEEEDMRRETLHLIVHPQNAFWSGHSVNIDVKAEQ